MTRVVTAHTSDLDAATLMAARALFDVVFGEDFDESDWEHGLGGVHALVYEGSELVGHASVIQRRLVHGERALRAGYVEGVCVHSAHRRRGYAGTMMAALEGVIRSAYDVGALAATDMAAPVYAGRGWRVWEGPLYALTPAGIVRTREEDGAVYVLPVSAPLDFRGALTCDWRDGDVW